MDDANALLRRFILALAVYREARNQSPRGKLLVAQVIENRVVDKRWPDNYQSVITQRFQFSSFNANDSQNTIWPKENDQAWLECVEAADKVMTTPTPFTLANHYMTKALFDSEQRPSWGREEKISEREGGHVFFTL